MLKNQTRTGVTLWWLNSIRTCSKLQLLQTVVASCLSVMLKNSTNAFIASRLDNCSAWLSGCPNDSININIIPLLFPCNPGPVFFWEYFLTTLLTWVFSLSVFASVKHLETIFYWKRRDINKTELNLSASVRRGPKQQQWWTMWGCIAPESLGCPRWLLFWCLRCLSAG